MSHAELSFLRSHTLLLQSRTFLAAGLIAVTTLGANKAANCSMTNPQSKANALLGRMTLDEKIGQMVQVDWGALTDKSDVQTYGLGSVLSGASSDPAGGNSAQSWLASVTELQ